MNFVKDLGKNKMKLRKSLNNYFLSELYFYPNSKKNIQSYPGLIVIVSG